MAGINLGRAYLTVSPSTKDLAPTLAKAWRAAQKDAKSAGEAAGAEYAKAAGDATKKKPLEGVFKDLTRSAKIDGGRAGQAFSTETQRATKGIRGRLASLFNGSAKDAGSSGRKSGDSFSKGTEKGTKGIRGKIASLFKGAENGADASGRSAGGLFNRGFGSVLGKVTAAAGVFGVGLSIGKTLSDGINGGLDRYLTKENALLKLEALGFDGDVRKEISDIATAHVQGTSFSSGGAIQVAADLSLAGQSGATLDKTIGQIVSSSALAGVSDLGEVGTIFSRIAMNGTAMTDELQQLQDRGIPVFDWLSKTLGKSVKDVRKDVTDNKVSFEMFSQAIEDNMNPEAAKIMATGFAGSMANLRSSLNQVGEQFWNEFGPAISDTAGKIMDWIKTLIPTAREFFGNLKDWIAAAIPYVKDMGDRLKGAFEQAQPYIETAWDVLKNTFTFLKNNIGIVTGVATAVLAGATAWKVYTGVVGGVKALAGGIKILNAVMRANPIGIIITAVAALVAGFIYLWKTNEGFRNFFIGMWDKIKSVTSTVVDWFKGPFLTVFNSVWDGLKTGLSGIANFFSGIWDSIKTGLGAVADFFSAAWDGIRLGIAVVLGIIKTIFDVYIGIYKAIWIAVSEFFMQIWEGIWSFIQPIVQGIVDFVVASWTLLSTTTSTIFNAIRDFFVGIWNAIVAFVSPIIQGFVDSIVGKWNWLKDTTSSIFNQVKTFFSTTWNSIRDTVVELATNIWTTVSGVFNNMKSSIETTITNLRDGISRIWNGIKNVFRDPINAVIRFINDPFIKNINSVLGKFGMGDKKIAPMKEIPYTRTSGTGSSRSMAVAMASGGVLPGWSPGRDIHSFHSPTAGTLHLSGGEGILRPEAVRALGGERGIHELNAKARRSRASSWHFANGGVWRPVPQGHSGWKGGRYRSGKWHGGLDFPAPTGTPIRAMWPGRVSRLARLGRSYGHHVRIDHGRGLETLYAHMSQILTSIGATVKGGQMIGRVGSTGNSTGPHLHLEVRRNGTQVNPEPYLRGASITGTGGASVAEAGGGFFDWIKDVWGSVSKPFDSLKGMLSGTGVVGDLLEGILGSVVGGAKDWLGNVLKFDAGGYLKPGSVGVNHSGKPEPVFTSDQWRNIEAVAAMGVESVKESRGGDTYHINGVKHDTAEELANELIKAQKKAQIRKRYTTLGV